MNRGGGWSWTGMGKRSRVEEGGGKGGSYSVCLPVKYQSPITVESGKGEKEGARQRGREMGRGREGEMGKDALEGIRFIRSVMCRWS